MRPGADNLKAIAVIPCLNEERFIGKVVAEAIKHVNKVIVIDDGSNDRTSAVAASAGAEVIKHVTRQGAGTATKTGFIEALRSGADIVVTLDGDGQHDASEIPIIVQPIREGKADFVIGSRFLYPANVPRYRKFGIDVITWLYNLGWKEKIVDAQSGFRAYSRKTIEAIDITYPGFEFSIQSLVRARKKRLKIVEAPVSCIYHDAGSTQNPITHGLSVLWGIVKIRLKEELFRTGRDSGL